MQYRDILVIVALVATLAIIGAMVAMWEGRRRKAARLIARAVATPSLTLRIPRPRIEELERWTGATATWSPIAEQANAEATRDPIAEAAAAELAELADAATALEPLLTACHKAMAKAWRDWDAALLGPMSTVAHWHNAVGSRDCEVCRARIAQVIGPVGPDHHLGVRAFRIDTPTAEFQILEARI